MSTGTSEDLGPCLGLLRFVVFVPWSGAVATTVVRFPEDSYGIESSPEVPDTTLLAIRFVEERPDFSELSGEPSQIDAT
jgi:hypothetical protein